MKYSSILSSLSNCTFTLVGSFFVFIAFALPASFGLTILTQISIWIGLLIIFSDRAGAPHVNRMFFYARIGLALNVCATFGVILFGKLLYSSNGEWWAHPTQVKIHSILGMVLLPLPTAYEYALKELGWRFTFPPDCIPLFSVFAFYFNVLLYIFIFLLIFLVVSVRGNNNKLQVTDLT